MFVGLKGLEEAVLEQNRWSAVYTHPNKELLASFHLQRQGYQTFFPVISKRVKHARKLIDRKISLFPCYIFVQLDPMNDRWSPINGTIGVRNLVMSGNRPALLPNGFVESLGNELAGKREVVSKQYPPLEADAVIKVQDGPFKGLVGQFEAMTGECRVRVLLEFLGGKVPVDIDRALVSSIVA